MPYMKRLIILQSVLLSTGFRLMAQEPTGIPNDSVYAELQRVKTSVSAFKNLKITGWAQIQYQYAESKGAPNYEGGNFAPQSNQRFFVRRARVKFTYDGKNSRHVMQINGVERGVNIGEIFSSLYLPKNKAFSMTAGIMNRPFGFEIEQSSSV